MPHVVERDGLRALRRPVPGVAVGVLGTEERDAVDHARGRVGVLLAGHELVGPQVLDALELRRLEARPSHDVAEDGERPLHVALEHRQRDEARVGVRVGTEPRADVVERASQVDRAELPCSLVEHVRRGVGEPALALRIARRAGRHGEVAGHERHLVPLEQPHRDPVGRGEHHRRRRDERRRRRRLRTRAERVGWGRRDGRGARRGNDRDHRRRRRPRAAGEQAEKKREPEGFSALHRLASFRGTIVRTTTASGKSTVFAYDRRSFSLACL